MYRRRTYWDEKRCGPDVVSQALRGVSRAGALLLLFGVALLLFAKPDARIAMFPRGGDGALWQQDLAALIPYWIVFGLALSSIGLWLNSKRLRRRGDSVRGSLVVLWIVSVVGSALLVIT